MSGAWNIFRFKIAPKIALSLVILGLAIPLTMGATRGIDWLFWPHGNWYVHGEQMGVTMVQFGNTSPDACKGTLIQGYFWPVNGNVGWGHIGGDTPPLSNVKAAHDWLAGCIAGLHETKSYNQGDS